MATVSKEGNFILSLWAENRDMKFTISPDDAFEAALQAATMGVVMTKFNEMANVLEDAVNTARDNVIAEISKKQANGELSKEEVRRYIEGINIKTNSGANSFEWELVIENDAKRMEDGFGPFDMIARGLVKHNKNVKFSEKTGRYYARIPF